MVLGLGLGFDNMSTHLLVVTGTFAGGGKKLLILV